MGKTVKTFPAGTYSVDLATIDPLEDLSGETAKGYYFRATARDGVGRYEEAVADYAKAFELDPTMIVAQKMQRVTARKLNAK